MTLYKYADAEQLSFLEFNLASQNRVIYDSIKEFNEKEAGITSPEPEEKFFGTNLTELKETIKRIIS